MAARQNNFLASLREWNQDFSGGCSAKYPLYYQLWLRHQLNSLFIAITTVQDCSPIFPQGGQGIRVWLVREPFMKAGWRDAPLALRDLALSNMPHSLNSQNPLSMTKSQCSLFNKNLLFLFFYYYYINNKTFLDQPQK